MKRTYTPSLEELSRQYGTRYFTVTTCERGHKVTAAADYGTLEDIVSTADSIIFSQDPAADLDRYSLRISYAGRELVHIPRVGDGPDSARVLPQPIGDRYEIRQIDAWAEYDGDVYEIIDRATREPLFAAIPCEV